MIDCEMKSPTMAWVENEAQIQCENNVEAGRCPLHVYAPFHTIIKNIWIRPENLSVHRHQS